MVEISEYGFNLNINQIKNNAEIEGCLLIKNLINVDIRGSFKKILPVEDEIVPDAFSVCQVNVSANTLAGTIRGFHYQIDPYLETKLISCIRGSVIDVLLDMRPTSDTYGKHAYYILTPSSGSLLVPPLVAHGFQSLEDETTLLYLHSNNYSPKKSKGVNPLDPTLGVHWPLPVRCISDSDRNLPSFLEIEN